MEREFLTWGNVIIWVVNSVLIYLSLNFRLYMIFHHPEKKLRARLLNRRRKEHSGMVDQRCAEC
jgi:hypothetical protein